jgi:hypothetical protein
MLKINWNWLWVNIKVTRSNLLARSFENFARDVKCCSGLEILHIARESGDKVAGDHVVHGPRIPREIPLRRKT